MKKKYLYIIAILLLVTLLLTACNGNGEGKKVQRIEVASGSFKIDYAIDEQLDLSKAYINVLYWDGYKEKKQVTADMISGFDSRRTNNEGQLTISFGGVAVSLFYTVGKNQSFVDTYARLHARKEGNDLILSLHNLGEYEDGIYAVTFLFISPEDIILQSLALGEGCVLESTKKPEGIKFLWYNSQAKPLTKDADIIKIKLKKSEDSSVQIKNIDISDGIEVIRLPSQTIIL